MSVTNTNKQTIVCMKKKKRKNDIYIISPFSIDHWCPLHLNNHGIVHVLWTQ